MSGPAEYTVIGLVNRVTGRLEIAAVIPGLVDPDNGFENIDTIRWVCHVAAADPYEAERVALDLHDFDGIPARYTAAELTVGSVVVDDANHGRRVRERRIADNHVDVWFADAPAVPVRYPRRAPLRAVIPDH